MGQKNSVTKLREGTGTYTYENKFFQYQGEWVNNVKHGEERSNSLGKGTLLMRDGSSYSGNFSNGEIMVKIVINRRELGRRCGQMGGCMREISKWEK